jgi:hypothetical protein
MNGGEKEHQQLWGYNVEDKLRRGGGGVNEQKMLNTTVFWSPKVHYRAHKSPGH